MLRLCNRRPHPVMRGRVGSKASVGRKTMDLKGKYVMPGIINLHGHIGNVIGLVQDPKNFTRANTEHN